MNPLQSDNTSSDTLATILAQHTQMLQQESFMQIEILGIFIALMILTTFMVFAAVFSVQSVNSTVKRFEVEVLQVIKMIGASYKDLP